MLSSALCPLFWGVLGFAFTEANRKKGHPHCQYGYWATKLHAGFNQQRGGGLDFVSLQGPRSELAHTLPPLVNPDIMQEPFSGCQAPFCCSGGTLNVTAVQGAAAPKSAR